MELQIHDLVSSIRKEGIDAANEQAEKIIADAKQKAEDIISKANADAKATTEAATREIETLREGAIENAEQAKRDAMISFKVDVLAEVDRILATKVREALNGETLGKLIKAVVVGEDMSNYTAEVAEVTEDLKAALAEEIRNGLDVRPVRSISSGFRLAAKDGSGYFDCTDEEIMQLLMPYFRDMDF